MNLYGKIEPKLNETVNENKRKIILFDPSKIITRAKFDKFSRVQSVSIKQLFPNLSPGICACGCGKLLFGRQTRWFSEECQKIPVGIYRILKGDLGYIKSLMLEYLPYCCAECGKEDYLIEKKGTYWNGQEYISYSAAGIQVDHILPVKYVGSGCWLGNYQFLCHKCNTAKNRKIKLTGQILF